MQSRLLIHRGPMFPLHQHSTEFGSPYKRITLSSPGCLFWNKTTSIHHKGQRLPYASKLQMRAKILEEVESDTFEVLPGLQQCRQPIGICETETLSAALSFKDAVNTLERRLLELQLYPPPMKSGILRFQVPLPPGIQALHWLESQPKSSPLLPRLYFSARRPQVENNAYIHNHELVEVIKEVDNDSLRAVAGTGACVTFQGSKPFSLDDWHSIRRFLAEESPFIRAYGSMRFDPHTQPSTEWTAFGSFYFFIPQIEVCECYSCSLLSVNIAWESSVGCSLQKALEKASRALKNIYIEAKTELPRKTNKIIQKEHVPDKKSWHLTFNKILDRLDNQNNFEWTDTQQEVIDNVQLTKIVMARQTRLELDGVIDPLQLLASLQEKNPSAYQFSIELAGGMAFFGNTPERLFARNGQWIASESVAGTRPRGPTTSSDYQIGLELLTSSKDHDEFAIVREGVREILEKVCTDVTTVLHKGLVKQPRVQHLYSQMIGKLHRDSGEYELLSGLHPTAAVCGQPQESARMIISRTENFDRGMYAGPVGWFGGNGAEFAVGIRSSLIQPGYLSGVCERASLNKDNSLNAKGNFPDAADQHIISQTQRTQMFLYAGVGIVKGAKASSEWRELELKISQFEALLQPRIELQEAININALWAKLIIEECIRLGVTYFCIAPGSRSSPLIEAAASNPHASCISCFDERSLAFYALGYGRGARKPAAVITSSGTAVSNLLPAVVEASQDCIPMLLLTADRPSELRDTGANQVIDQVNHFGKFVRYHFDLPAASDDIPAKMVLTTIDNAISHASGTSWGPVHINCPFREPLEGTYKNWNHECVGMLDKWARSSRPFTQYIHVADKLSNTNPQENAEMAEIADILNRSKRGLLVVGYVSNMEDGMAVLELIKHLQWPAAADILSGIRFQCSSSNNEGNIDIIHNMDHILLSNSIHSTISPDVILQIGGRITSKRLSQFMEKCSPDAHILVADYPNRHDPSHTLSHRMICTIKEFALHMTKELPSGLGSSLSPWLHLLSEVVHNEVYFQLALRKSLTEPFIASFITSSLPPNSALFLGNSMPIRDVDMYAGLQQMRSKSPVARGHECLPGVGIHVAANRGASGIDGVISTAIGFAVGSKKRLTLLIGDLSFIYDTNGLILMRTRVDQLPLTIIVVNNNGGGIFSMLPLSKTMEAAAFTSLVSTTHDINLADLCHAHMVNHMVVETKEQLSDALQSIQTSQSNWVLEVTTNIKDNAEFHRKLQMCTIQALDRTANILTKFCTMEYSGWTVSDVKYYHFRLPLHSYTSTVFNELPKEEASRDGLLLKIVLSNGYSGFGEVAPLEGLHHESLLDAEQQLRFIGQKLNGAPLNWTLLLLDGSFTNWIQEHLQVKANTLFPSVRCGLEMAVLGALSACTKYSLFYLLSGMPSPRNSKEVEYAEVPKVHVCGLIDSQDSPEDVARIASGLVRQGFTTLKLKVGRRKSPLEDAAVIVAVRKSVGESIHLRVDANQRWNLLQALAFSDAVQNCHLQYIEEPVPTIRDIEKFCKNSKLPVALDESIDKCSSNCQEMLQTLARHGVVAVVIKPGRVGGFERAYSLARASQNHGLVVVISAAFESTYSLAAYAQFAAVVDKMHEEAITSSSSHNYKTKDISRIPAIAHGLGTYMWLKEDIIANKLPFTVKGKDGMEVQPTKLFGQQVPLRLKVAAPALSMSNIIEHAVSILVEEKLFNFHIRETPKGNNQLTLVFLHGFLGTGTEWVPIMNSLSTVYHCISLDLPGHGQSTVIGDNRKRINGSAIACNWSMECLSEAISKLLDKLDVKHVILIGYSMGARLAMHTALKKSQQVQVAGAVIVSGSPGLEDSHVRARRVAADDGLAEYLRKCDLKNFVDSWYRKPMWKSLRDHPAFKAIKEDRIQHRNSEGLAECLSALSIGRQLSLWEALPQVEVPILIVVGSLDKKFVKIAHDMIHRVSNKENEHKMDGNNITPMEILEIEDCGHAVHLENPLPLLKALHTFMLRLTSSFKYKIELN